MKSELIIKLLKAVHDHEVRKHKKESTEQTICLSIKKKRREPKNVSFFQIIFISDLIQTSH